MSLEQSLATLARAVAADLNRFAAELSQEPPSNARRTAVSASSLVQGPRQRSIVSLAELAVEQGVTTKDIANAIEYEVPNTLLTLQGLARHGLVEKVPNTRPQRWRLTAPYRGEE